MRSRLLTEQHQAKVVRGLVECERTDVILARIRPLRSLRPFERIQATGGTRGLSVIQRSARVDRCPSAMHPAALLGRRLKAGHGTLNPIMMVRIHPPNSRP